MDVGNIAIEDAYAQRGMMVCAMAEAIDNVRDEKTRKILRDAMTRLVLTMELPKAEAPKIAFVKPAKDA